VGEVTIRRSATGAWAGWAGPEAKAQWEEGGATGKKKNKNGPRLGRKARWAGSDEKILFRIKFDFGIYHGFGNLHKEI
jgi:hypothetical protein